MSSLRRTISSRTNGAKSHGPTSPEGKARSSQNATTHGLFAECILLEGEDRKAFDELVQYHKDRFQPADGVELDIVKQICAAQWRLYRVQAMETQALNKHIATQPAGPCPYYLADAFEAAAALPSMALLQRHESRLQLIHQRALRSFKLLRTIDVPSQEDSPNEIAEIEPSPITEQPEQPPQPADSEPLEEAGISPAVAEVSPVVTVPAQPPAQPSPLDPGGAA